MTRVVAFRAGLRFFVHETEDIAPLTRRVRCRVVCENCNATIHVSTVDPDGWIRSHVAHEHDGALFE